VTKTLAEWDVLVRPHLRGIREGAERCSRHTTQLLQRPLFDTLAFDDLEKLETVLAEALLKVSHAKQVYQAKPTED